MTEKKPRKPNWTSEEMEVLAEAYLSSYKVIRGKLTPVVTSEVKKRAWENITDKLVIDMFIFTFKKKVLHISKPFIWCFCMRHIFLLILVYSAN